MSKNISKFLSYTLRHAPEKIGLSVDEFGWASIDELIKKANKSGQKLTMDLLMKTVSECDKKRFTISGDGLNIRAAQGHSISVELEHDPVKPPVILFHGTADRFLPSIQSEGLTPRSRNYVHLSKDIETASAVGRRHGRLVILRVSSAKMYEDSHSFWLAENGVWLCEAVPPVYFEVEKSNA